MFGKKKNIDVDKYEELVNELYKQVEVNNQLLLSKCDEVLELIREAQKACNISLNIDRREVMKAVAIDLDEGSKIINSYKNKAKEEGKDFIVTVDGEECINNGDIK